MKFTLAFLALHASQASLVNGYFRLEAACFGDTAGTLLLSDETATLSGAGCSSRKIGELWEGLCSAIVTPYVTVRR